MTGSAKTPEPADACILRVEPAGQPRVMVDRQPGDVPDAFGMVRAAGRGRHFKPAGDGDGPVDGHREHEPGVAGLEGHGPAPPPRSRRHGP